MEMSILNEKEKEQLRFKMRAEEIEITFKPQCIICNHNININTCEEFDFKPREYISNEEDCPKHVNKPITLT